MPDETGGLLEECEVQPSVLSREDVVPHLRLKRSGMTKELIPLLGRDVEALEILGIL
jgi:hypothetical protein